MDVFAITPASSKPLWFLVAICTLLATVLIVLVFTAYSSRNSRVEIDHGNLKIIGDFWGRTIPIKQLNVAAARVVNITGNSDLVPKRRTLGTGLPGYASGWFRLRNGEKALVYLTQRYKVAYVPTSAGYSLLLSVENPTRLIHALKNTMSNEQ